MTQTTLLILFLLFEAVVVAGILVMVLHLVSVRRAIGGGSHKGGKVGWKLNTIPGAAPESSEPAVADEIAEEESLRDEAEQAAPESSEPAVADEIAEEESLRDEAEQGGAGRGDGPDTPAGQAPAQPSPGSPDEDLDYEVLEITLPGEESNTR